MPSTSRKSVLEVKELLWKLFERDFLAWKADDCWQKEWPKVESALAQGNLGGAECLANGIYHRFGEAVVRISRAGLERLIVAAEHQSDVHLIERELRVAKEGVGLVKERLSQNDYLFAAIEAWDCHDYLKEGLDDLPERRRAEAAAALARIREEMAARRAEEQRRKEEKKAQHQRNKNMRRERDRALTMQLKARSGK